jgi:hypothetical protein
MVVPVATEGVGFALGVATGAGLGEAAGAPYGLPAPVDELPHAAASNAAATMPPVNTKVERILIAS